MITSKFSGYFVLNKKIFNYLKNDQTLWEKEPLEKLSKENKLIAYKHKNFWKCMDNIADKNYLEKYLKNYA